MRSASSSQRPAGPHFLPMGGPSGDGESPRVWTLRGSWGEIYNRNHFSAGEVEVPGNTHPNSLWLARNERFFATLTLLAKPGLHWICAYTQLGPKITPHRSGREKEFFFRKKKFSFYGHLATRDLHPGHPKYSRVPGGDPRSIFRGWLFGPPPACTALYCSTVQPQPRRALLGARRTLLGLQRALLGLQKAVLWSSRPVYIPESASASERADFLL